MYTSHDICTIYPKPHVAMKCFFEVNMLTEIIKTASAVLMPPVKPIPATASLLGGEYMEVSMGIPQ